MWVQGVQWDWNGGKRKKTGGEGECGAISIGKKSGILKILE
jgi:hypothetical protein